MQDKKILALRIFLSVLGTAAVFLIAVFCVQSLWSKAPELEPEAPSMETLKTEISEDDNGVPVDTERQDGVYTILLVGNDDGNGNTDTVLVGKIDSKLHRMDFVSIPRDTLINVDWTVRKLNSVYWGSKNSGGNGIDALKAQVKKLTGFEVDCYAVIDLGIFIDVIDAMGGVDFDVPVPMHYVDEGQNLYIDLEPGPQHLDGYQAMGLCRFRSGYANGDYGRIEMQQKFLKACAEQFITIGNIPNLSKVVRILADGLDTDLNAANIGFFLHQALKCQADDINFYTVPSNSDYVGGLSYSVIDIWQWLPMLNSSLNPYETPVEYSNLDIVYKDGGSYTATTYLKGEWFYASSAPTAAITPENEEEKLQEDEGPTIIVIPQESIPPVTVPDAAPEEGENEPQIILPDENVSEEVEAPSEEEPTE